MNQAVSINVNNPAINRDHLLQTLRQAGYQVTAKGFKELVVRPTIIGVVSNV